MISDKQLRDNTVALLLGNTDAEARVYSSLADPTTVDELPLIAVYTTDFEGTGEIKGYIELSMYRNLEIDILVDADDATWADKIDAISDDVMEILFTNDGWKANSGTLVKLTGRKETFVKERTFGIGRLILQLQDNKSF